MNNRSSTVKKNIIYGVLIKGINILSTLLLIPLTINYISSELYGLWLAISSVIQWISFFDIGFGNGLKNKLAFAVTLKHYKLGKIYVSTTYAVVGIVFSCIGILSYILVPHINWSSFFNVESSLNETLIVVIRIVVISFSLQFILKLIQNVMQAYQLTAMSNAIDTCGNTFSLLCIYAITKLVFPDLTYIALGFCISPLTVIIIASIVLYSGKFKAVSPSIHHIRFKYAKEIFGLGSKFFIIQIACLVLYQTINLIIVKTCSPEHVTIYNIVYKYVSIAAMGFTIIMAPMWPAFTDAYALKDYKWMQYIYNKLKKLFYLSIIGMLILICISPIAYNLWIGDSVSIPFSVTVCLSVYTIIMMWNNLNSYIINGIGKIKLQLYTSIFLLLINLPLSIYGGIYYGLIGIIASMIIVNLLPAIVLGIQVKRIINQKSSGIWDK